MPAISIVYALADEQVVVRLNVDAGATVADAVARSGLLDRFPLAPGSELVCAIFGQVVPLSRVLDEGERIEILRPLLIDPKENRRRAAARSRR